MSDNPLPQARAERALPPDNLASHGQEIGVEVDAAEAVALELEPGEMSLHNVKPIHGSERSNSATRRIGLAGLSDAAIAHRAQATGASSRILMRGTDRM